MRSAALITSPTLFPLSELLSQLKSIQNRDTNLGGSLDGSVSLRAVASDVSFLLALVASLRSTRSGSDATSGGSAVPGEVVDSSTGVATNLTTSHETTTSSSESTTRVSAEARDEGSTSYGCRGSTSGGSLSSSVDRGGNDGSFTVSSGSGSSAGARSGDVSELLAAVALGSVAGESTNANGRALGGKVTHSTARVALLVVSDLGVGASVRLVSSLTTVEAQTLSRSASGSDVTGLAANEASTTAHRERHSFCLDLKRSTTV